MKHIIIYARSSSAEASAREQQERYIREALKRQAVDDAEAITLPDQSGRRGESGRNLALLRELIRQGVVDVLAISDWSRLPGGEEGIRVVMELEEAGGRVICADGSDRPAS